jgi:hypothetical protein
MKFEVIGPTDFPVPKFTTDVILGVSTGGFGGLPPFRGGNGATGTSGFGTFSVNVYDDQIFIDGVVIVALDTRAVTTFTKANGSFYGVYTVSRDYVRNLMPSVDCPEAQIFYDISGNQPVTIPEIVDRYYPLLHLSSILRVDHKPCKCILRDVRKKRDCDLLSQHYINVPIFGSVSAEYTTDQPTMEVGGNNMVKFPKVTFTPNRSKFDPFQLDVVISVAVGSDGSVGGGGGGGGGGAGAGGIGGIGKFTYTIPDRAYIEGIFMVNFSTVYNDNRPDIVTFSHVNGFFDATYTVIQDGSKLNYIDFLIKYCLPPNTVISKDNILSLIKAILKTST